MARAWRIGVATRLIAGLALLTLISAVAGAVAVLSFNQVQRSFNSVASTHLSTMLLASRLEQESQALTGLAPILLMKGLDEGELLAFSYAVFGRQSSLEQLIGELRGIVTDPAMLTNIETASAELFKNLDAMSTVLYARASADSDAGLALTRFLDAYDTTVGTLKSVSADAAAGMRPVSVELATGAVDWLGALNDLSAVALKIRATGAAVTLDALEARATQLLRSSSTAHEQLVAELPELAGEQQRLEAALLGKNGLVASRRQIITTQAEVGDLLDRNARIAQGLIADVDTLITEISADVAAQNEALGAMLSTRRQVMTALAAIGLLGAVVIGVYFQRSVIRRLDRLHQSMRDDHPVESVTDLTRGHDEIAEMAASFVRFVTEIDRRDAALRKSQQRLINAIESIPEGFSLYDADDRLVTSNSRYVSMLYPGMEGTVEPGEPFEAVVRRAASRGVVEDAVGRVDEWVAERMASHRSRADRTIQVRVGGRWIEIAERHTSDGDTVAVYADITDRKNFETQLLEGKLRTEEANCALETLSRKLSKYLSPQLYASIFTGTRQVEIASQRKKLTIFFSDIADFTETVDSLESEEATALLNHYLNEMSRIALGFGATIDKYIGDAMLIFFGDPESKGPQEDARACVRMAIEMQKRMRALQSEWREHGLERPFQMRIGINTGYCTVGNFGTEERMDYTIIGSEVNLAARLQTHAELGSILLSHETYSLVRDIVQAEERAPVTVKGFSRPIRNYAVVGLADEFEPQGPVIRRRAEGFRLEIDLDRMTAAQKRQAIEELAAIMARMRDDRTAAPDAADLPSGASGE